MSRPAKKPTRKEKIAASQVAAISPSNQTFSSEDVVSAIEADEMRDLINAAIQESEGNENVKCISATADVLHFVVKPDFDDLVPLMASKEVETSQLKGNVIMSTAQAHQQTTDYVGINDLLNRFGTAETRLGGMEQTIASVQGRVSALETRASTIVSSNSGSGVVTDYTFSDMTGRVATGVLTGLGLAIGATAVTATVQLVRGYFDNKSEE